MSEYPVVSITEVAKESLKGWQNFVDKQGLRVTREEMRQILNLEIVVQQLIGIVEDAQNRGKAEEAVTQ